MLMAACSETETAGVNKFSDDEIVKIYDFKDKRLSDSLYPYFNHATASYRRDAALAFASIQDSNAVEKLCKFFMKEQDPEVRKAIAFALGQIPSQETERSLLGAIIKEKELDVLSELLESYGKTTPQWQLIHPNFLNDTLKAKGLAWSLYRSGVRGKADTTINPIAITLTQEDHHYSTQLAASHFFARGSAGFEGAFNEIKRMAIADESPDVRMAATLALRQIKTPESLSVLKSVLADEKDDRVKINAVRALQNFPFEEVKQSLYAALYDKHVNLAVAASEVTAALATKEYWIELSNIAGRIENWRVQANIYQAALKATNNEALVNEVVTLFQNAKNPFQKAALLTALKSSISQFNYISDQMINADTAVVRTSAAVALAAMSREPGFNQQSKFLEVAKQGMQTGDAAVIGTFAEVLSDETLGYTKLSKDFDFLLEARKKLTLPKDNEAIQPLEKAISLFQGKKENPVVNEYNHPIDWELVKKIPADQVAIIKTNRGHIKIRLFVEEAPGAVSNFVSLARKNYFDGKAFHRVVPNFVIQGGCSRGDGWGSEDYSIRSEFSPRRYTMGSVGMASAGKDTEGTQWFITHSPTPHLDGRYTIFAEVIDGMDAVNFIEVGDEIIDVEIVGFK